MATTPQQAAEHYENCCYKTRKEYQEQFGQDDIPNREVKFNEWLAHELDVRTEIKKLEALGTIEKLMGAHGINLTDVVDLVIANNGIIGVGLISLGQALDKHCTDQI